MAQTEKRSKLHGFLPENLTQAFLEFKEWQIPTVMILYCHHEVGVVWLGVRWFHNSWFNFSSIFLTGIHVLPRKPKHLHDPVICHLDQVKNFGVEIASQISAITVIVLHNRQNKQQHANFVVVSLYTYT